MYLHIIYMVMHLIQPLPPELPCACANLRRAARAVSQLYDAELAAADLTITQFTLLQVLARVRRIRQRELGDLLVMDSTTLTRTLRPMLAKGLVQSVVGNDRRERHWVLTATGQRQLARATPMWQRTQAGLRRDLGDAGWEQLQTVTRLVAGLGPERDGSTKST
jgi:DNA-binding MarR family transcriptional regulator